MKFIVLFALVTCLFSVQAEAKRRVIEPEEATVVRNTSAHLREDQNYQVNAQIFGIGPSLASTSGLQFGKFIDSDRIVFLEVMSGKLNSNVGSDSFGSAYDIKSTSFGAHYKQFHGNSFYWRGGIDYRTVDSNYNFTGFSAASSASRKFQGNSIALNFQIGNQWQWDNFTMGCDWIGYSLPVSSNVSSESVVSTDFAYDQRRNREDQDTLLKNAHANLLRFYLGLSF